MVDPRLIEALQGRYGIEREIEIAARLDHSHILSTYLARVITGPLSGLEC